MGKIPVKGEKEQGRDGIGFMADTRQKYIWVCLQAVQKMPEYNVSKYCLIPWSQYRGMQPESQLTTNIQQKLCGE